MCVFSGGAMQEMEGEGGLNRGGPMSNQGETSSTQIRVIMLKMTHR